MASLSDLPKVVVSWDAAEAYGRSLLVARKNTADVTFSVRRELQVRGYQPKLEFASEALGELYSEIASSLISIPFGAALKAASGRGAAVAEVPVDLPDEIDPLRQAFMQRLAEAVRYRAMGWNHEQGKFSIIETMAISRTERTFNKRFLPSNIEGVDVIDPAGWGNVSLKGPFLDKNLQPLASEFQMKAVGNISKHVANNTAVNTHVIDMTGLSDQAVKALQQSLQGSNVRIIYVKGEQ